MASKKQREIEARKAADPIAQVMEREDIDYSSDELPSAPRVVERRTVQEWQASIDRVIETGETERILAHSIEAVGEGMVNGYNKVTFHNQGNDGILLSMSANQESEGEGLVGRRKSERIR